MFLQQWGLPGSASVVWGSPSVFCGAGGSAPIPGTLARLSVTEEEERGPARKSGVPKATQPSPLL